MLLQYVRNFVIKYTYNYNQYGWENNCKQFPQNIPAEIYCNFDLVFLVRLKFN